MTHVDHPVNARLRSFLQKCHLSSSKFRVLTPRHVFTPPPRTAKGLSPEQHLGWLASQAEEPMLTLLALLALQAVLHSQAEEPMLILLAFRTSPRKPRNQC